MEDLTKKFKINSHKNKIKTILKLAGFDDMLFKNVGDYLTELSQKSWKIECWVDLDKNNMNFIIVGNRMEIRFEKEISDEALIDVFDKDHNPIILKEIQNSVIMLEDKGYNLMSKKEEIENILKCLKSC